MKQHYPPRPRCPRCGVIGQHDKATCDRLKAWLDSQKGTK